MDRRRENILMRLGLKRNEVRLVPHNQEWIEEFLRVKKDIVRETRLEPYRIEHIGSTAIRGIEAKPIIDILIGIDNLDYIEDALFKGLKKTGFLRLKVIREAEIVLAKFTDDSFEEKTHFIHLVEYQGRKWTDLIFFRDYMNSNELARKEYEEIKKSFVRHKQEGINEYTAKKESFVNKICALNKE